MNPSLSSLTFSPSSLENWFTRVANQFSISLISKSDAEKQLFSSLFLVWYNRLNHKGIASDKRLVTPSLYFITAASKGKVTVFYGDDSIEKYHLYRCSVSPDQAPVTNVHLR